MSSNNLTDDQLKKIERWYRDGKPSSYIDPPSFGYLPKFPFVSKLITEFAGMDQELSVLDVGCFTGYLLRHIIKDGHQCTGIDIQQQLMEELNKLYAPNPRFMYGNAEYLDELFEKETFDVVLMLDVLEHVIDDDAAIAATNAVVKSSGMVMVHLPLNFEYPDLSGEHVHRYTRPELEELFKPFRNVRFYDLVDEAKRPTILVTYQP